MSQSTTTTSATIVVENIGGIDTGEVTFSPGVTIFTGRNATNRTSLLTAIGGALGGSTATVKSDTDKGQVTLNIDGETYTRQYTRQNGSTVSTDGEPYTDQTELVDLFTCILEANPARRAVERGDDLREVIMRPVDTESIQERVRTLERERDRVVARIEEVNEEQDRLPSLEEQRTRLRDDLEEITDELDTVQGQVNEYEADAAAAEAAEELLDDLDSKRQALTETRNEIQTERASLEALQDERDDVITKLSNLPEQNADPEELERELNQLKDQERGLAETIDSLSAIVEFNQELVDGTGDLPGIEADQDVTADLDPASEAVQCWTCGSRVQRSAIADRLEDLRTIIDEKRAERNDLTERISDLREQRSELQETRSQRENLEQRRESLLSKITHRENRVDEFEAAITDIQAEIKELETDVEETEELRESDLVEQYQRLSELEYERGQVEQELRTIEDEITAIEALTDEQTELETESEDLQDELASLRTHIEDTERNAVEAFNEHMADVLALLEYENLERVWIERKTRTDGGPEGHFELHIVRSTETGSMYEDTVDTLSESEREVVGLVVTLAGYLVHEVYETVPMVLLDSLEALDADRIAMLIEYLADFASYLLVALLPEDAQAVDEAYSRLDTNEVLS